jgi:hypothetical protein
MQRGDAYPIPKRSPEAASTRVTATLYDVLAALQTLVEPEEDDVVVAIVAEWLRSGRLRFLEDVTIAA